MTSVALLVPWNPGCPWREKSWAWLRARYQTAHPEWSIIEGRSTAPAFSRTQAILDAAAQTRAEVIVVADADVWTDGLELAIEHALRGGWAIPHLLIHRLAESSTLRVLGGTDWRGQQLSTDNRQDSRPYRGHEAGTLLVLSREAFEAAPPDPRFVGWGSEDRAWSLALRTLVGSPWRGSADLVHLWHPAQERTSRIVGNAANHALLRRYTAARTNPGRMSELVTEGKGVTL